jgi:hypothetical protein
MKSKTKNYLFFMLLMVSGRSLKRQKDTHPGVGGRKASDPVSGSATLSHVLSIFQGYSSEFFSTPAFGSNERISLQSLLNDDAQSRTGI